MKCTKFLYTVLGFQTNLDLEIARRVEKWHEKLEPVLRVAEARSEFDVQDYCTR
jgi:hypothetical protein